MNFILMLEEIKEHFSSDFIIFMAIFIIVIAFFIFALLSKLIDQIKSPKSRTTIENCDSMQYYAFIRKEDNPKKYKVIAEIKATVITNITFSLYYMEHINRTIKSFDLYRIYWSNGGYISFIDETQKSNCLFNVVFNKEQLVTDVKGDRYYLTIYEYKDSDIHEASFKYSETMKKVKELEQKVKSLNSEIDQKKSYMQTITDEISEYNEKKHSLKKVVDNYRTIAISGIEKYKINVQEEMETLKRVTNAETDIYKHSSLAEIDQYKEHAKSEIDAYRKSVYDDINKVINNSKIDFPYIATVLADYQMYLNSKIADELINKRPPALKASEVLAEKSKKYRELEIKYRVLKYQQEIYEDIFPWLTDFKQISHEDISEIKHNDNKEQSEKQLLGKYITKSEYDSLSRIEKYQLALERYKEKKKTNWQIGIDFERYIGYMYECQGYKVTYYGARKGLEDLGRDLIACKDNEIEVIQCKYWSKEKTIHEKHIFQLFGTMFALSTDKSKILMGDEVIKLNNIKGRFITSTTLSETAKLYAEKLNIEIEENVEFDKAYPLVKCNVGKNGEKIYHLPFDQQYDNIVIDKEKGELYVTTVQEAEDLGFRRAHKWTGSEER